MNQKPRFLWDEKETSLCAGDHVRHDPIRGRYDFLRRNGDGVLSTIDVLVNGKRADHWHPEVATGPQDPILAILPENLLLRQAGGRGTANLWMLIHYADI